MKKSLAWKLYFVGGLLVLAALLISGPSLVRTFAIPVAQVPIDIPVVPHNEIPTIAGTPVRVVVPSRNIDLAVIDGNYNEKTGEWTLTDTKAQFATLTSLANNKAGSTLIYGHDTDRVFKRLEGLKPGDEAYVTVAEGETFVYRFRSQVEVSPKDTSILHYSGPPVLTLQTCSGAWSQHRMLMTFDFVEVR